VTSLDISLTLCKIVAVSRQPSPLPPKEALILELLVDARELYGLELVARSRRRLKRGTVYVTLGRMEQKGLITSRLEAPPPSAGGMPRRIYQATPAGRRVLAAWTALTRAMGHLNPEFAR
jgi:PadR family transcriptional regulator PadR